MGREREWLTSFQPCVKDIIPGFGIQTCVSPRCSQLPCLESPAYVMAYRLLDGRDIEELKKGYTELLNLLSLGRKVILPCKRIVEVTEENMDEVVDSVGRRAQQIVKGVRECMTNTLPLTSSSFEVLPQEEQEAILRIWQVKKKIDSFQGNLDEATVLANEMKDALSNSLDLDLGKFDSIARLALAHGLSDRIPAITAEKIFIGDPEKLRPSPSVADKPSR